MLFKLITSLTTLALLVNPIIAAPVSVNPSTVAARSLTKRDHQCDNDYPGGLIPVPSHDDIAYACAYATKFGGVWLPQGDAGMIAFQRQWQGTYVAIRLSANIGGFWLTGQKCIDEMTYLANNCQASYNGVNWSTGGWTQTPDGNYKTQFWAAVVGPSPSG